MCHVARDEHDWTWGYGIEVAKGIEIHKLGLAGERRVGGEVWCRTCRCELASGCAVEVVELA